MKYETVGAVVSAVVGVVLVAIAFVVVRVSAVIGGAGGDLGHEAEERGNGHGFVFGILLDLFGSAGVLVGQCIALLGAILLLVALCFAVAIFRARAAAASTASEVTIDPPRPPALSPRSVPLAPEAAAVVHSSNTGALEAGKKPTESSGSAL